MKIFKVLILTLFLTIFSFNIAYSDEISYQDEWLKATYTNRKITKDISHWEFDRNFFATHDLSGDNLVSYGIGEWKEKPNVHRIRVIDSPAGYFYWEPGEGYQDFENRVDWSKTTEIHRDGIDFVVDIPYYREYSNEGMLGGGFGIFVWSFRSDKVYYRDFKATFDTPSGTKTYHISEMANWVEKYIEEEATHGTFTIEKFPTYVFTKWHKLSDGTPCGMDLTISWDATRRFQNLKAQMIVVRYQDMGEDIFDIYDGSADSSGRIETRLEFEHAGNEESKLLIEFVTEEGNWGTIEAPIPVNGFFGINISEPVPVKGIFKKSPKDEGEFNF